jgi:hypothetical protein
MLRALVLIVLLLNAVLFAWGAGYLAPLAAPPGPVREPQRLVNQLNPEKFKLVGAAQPVSAALSASLCLSSAGNDPSLLAALNAALAGAGYSAEIVSSEGRDGAQWMVYIGKLANEEAVRTKLAELGRLKITDFAPIADSATWQPGVSLGVYRDRERAEVRLRTLVDAGVRSAKVVERRAGAAVINLTLPKVAESERAKLTEALAKAGGKPLEVCSS